MRIGLVIVAALAISAVWMASAATHADGTALTSRPAADRPLPGLTATQVKEMLAEPTQYARWACVLAGLALAGVIWMGWSMRTLAQNQVALAKLIAKATGAD